MTWMQSVALGWLLSQASTPGRTPPWQPALQQIESATATMVEIVQTPTSTDTFEGRIWLRKPADFRMDAPPYVLLGQQGQVILWDLQTGKQMTMGQYPADLSWLWHIDSLFVLHPRGSLWIGVPKAPEVGIDSFAYQPGPQGLPDTLILYFPTQTLFFTFTRWQTGEVFPDSLFRIPPSPEHRKP